MVVDNQVFWCSVNFCQGEMGEGRLYVVKIRYFIYFFVTDPVTLSKKIFYIYNIFFLQEFLLPLVIKMQNLLIVNLKSCHMLLL